MRKGKKLNNEGWTRQFVASEPRLSEAIEIYESLGLEVKVEPVDKNDSAGGCTECLDEKRDKIIYTRVKPKNRKKNS